MNLFENLQKMHENEIVLNETNEMSIDVDAIYPFESKEDEDEFNKTIKNYNLKFDLHSSNICPAGGELTVVGDPREIKRYFTDVKWDDWFVQWEDDDDAKEQFMKITGEDEDGWDEFLYD